MKKAKHKRVARLATMFFFVFCSIAQRGKLIAQTNPGESVKRCATMEAYYFGLKNSAIERDPLRIANERINEFIAQRKGFRIAETDVIRIPVVVHVVHNNASERVGGRGNSNITDEQIESQIRVLNQDYRRMAGTPGYNDHPAGVDTRIEFFLAEVDPEGAQTTGITRNYYAEKSQFNPYSDAAILASISSWPTDEYLNIWVCTLTGNYLGVAQFPSLVGVPGLDNADADKPDTDGVIIDYRSFGDVGAISNTNYNQGRTTTHEIGHWLGLLHTWGDRRCGDDYCDDTPWAETSNTQSCNDLFSSCLGFSTRNMIENYMDYSPDRCMNIFTANQMERMYAVLELSPRRARLVENAKRARLEESEYMELLISPNPVIDTHVQIQVKHRGYQDVKLVIFDLQGRRIHQSEYKKIGSRRFKLPVNTFTPGIYVVEVTNELGEKLAARFAVK